MTALRTLKGLGTEPNELGSLTNANGTHYLFEYDSDLRLIERRTFDGRRLRTVWDGARIASTFDGSGRETTYEYGPRELVTRQTNLDGDTTYDYDDRGLLARVQTASSTLSFLRDEAGRIVSEDQDGIRIQRTFDVDGLPLSHTTPFGPTCTFDWSPAGVCRTVQYGDTSIGFERDALGREVRRTLGLTGVLEQSYDPVGRLAGQRLTGLPSQRLSSARSQPGVARQFGFDSRGFLQSIHDSIRGHSRLTHNDRGDLTGVVRSTKPSDFYAYDGCQNRVVHAATEHGAALALALDRPALKEGAIGTTSLKVLAASVPHTETEFSYGRGDRVVRITSANGHTDLTYNLDGQVITKTIVRGTNRAVWNYTWNSRSELIEITTPNGLQWHYGYDAAGRRISKRSPVGDIWRYVWMETELRHVLKNGQLVETYVREPDGTCALARDDGVIHFIIPDQNDAPSEEISRDGKLAWVAQKGTWGEEFSPTGTGGEPALGQWHDQESGLHYNLFRWYDPELGRFLSPDPIELAGGTNLYYSFSDPYTECDRFGLVKKCPPNRTRKGKKRGPKTRRRGPHNKKIRETAEKLAAEGNQIIAGGGVKPEVVVPTPDGEKDNRRPDIIYRTKGGRRRGVNVGLTLADGVTPVPRERSAMADLKDKGKLPMDDFVPYGIRGQK